jgi:hypothetical protein
MKSPEASSQAKPLRRKTSGAMSFTFHDEPEEGIVEWLVKQSIKSPKTCSNCARWEARVKELEARNDKARDVLEGKA